MKKRIISIFLTLILALTMLVGGQSYLAMAAQTENENSTETAVTAFASEDVAAEDGTEEDSSGSSSLKLETTDPALLEEVNGCTLGILTGSICDQLAAQYLPDCKLAYYNSTSDLAVALESGKIDAYYMDEPVATMLTKEYTSQYIYAVVTTNEVAFVFAKDDPESDQLRAQMNAYLAKIKADGTFEEIKEIWFGEDESRKVVDYDSLTGENGTVKFSTVSSVGIPFAYVKNADFVGYDVDMAVRFCKEYGYDIKIIDSDFTGLLTGVATGKSQFAAACITVTDERKESVNFSEANYYSGTVVVRRHDTAAEENVDFLTKVKNILADIGESFEKTFVREDRWKLFVNGLITTLLITLTSGASGTLLGFGIYLIYRKKFKTFNAIINGFSSVFGKTPVVVILMILYYVVFGSSEIKAMWVSTIGFTMMFACTVNGVMSVAVGAVDSGQMEAARALGYADTKAFVRIVFPQALRHFLPVYKNELVALIKATAVVGYITVQDLTRVSDIVRSSTYEPFLPLIASAVIYFLTAVLLTKIVRRIEIKTDNTNRSKEKILRGIKTK